MTMGQAGTRTVRSSVSFLGAVAGAAIACLAPAGVAAQSACANPTSSNLLTVETMTDGSKNVVAICGNRLQTSVPIRGQTKMKQT
ncbi:MAG TPA: hypothetical protein PK765_06330 [bacterium]|nr:hypothetical protein [bacterium]